MFKYNTLLTALLVFVLSLASCDKLLYDQPDDGGGAKVFLSVNYGGVASFRSSVSDTDSPNTPTINTDTDDYEDWVHSLALFVFDNTTGALIATHTEHESTANGVSSSFTIELTPGERDFYFVANMPEATIADRDEMDDYMKEINTLDPALYNAAAKTKGFPMARVYTNQTVSEGGTVYQPTPFKPNGDAQVLLIRAVAKLEVWINDAEFEQVESITLKNAYKNYHLLHNDTRLENIAHYENDIVLTERENSDENVTNGSYYFAYMPEALMPTATTWGTGDHKPVNYFVIKNKSDKEFVVPMITDEDNFDYSDNYLKFAKGELTEKPNYNLYRNRRYKYTVKNLSDIEVMYNVNDWTYVPKTLYMGYGYNVEVDKDGNITIINTIDDCMPHQVTLTGKDGVKLKYKDEDGIPIGNLLEAITYGYKSDSEVGYSKEKAAKGYFENFKVIPDTDGGSLEIRYNDDLVKTLSIKPITE